eukprot:7286822-Prymnesium_polylepis.1
MRALAVRAALCCWENTLAWVHVAICYVPRAESPPTASRATGRSTARPITLCQQAARGGAAGAAGGAVRRVAMEQ